MIEPEKTEVNLKIAQIAIGVIGLQGLEKLSFKQIAIAGNMNMGTITKAFDCTSKLLAFCLTLSLESLADFLCSNKPENSSNTRSMEALWTELVEFHIKYKYKAMLIGAYFIKPSSFPAVNLRHFLSGMVSTCFKKTDHVLKQCNNEIMLIAFIHMFLIARQASISQSKSKENFGDSAMITLYRSDVREQLLKFTKLPFC